MPLRRHRLVVARRGPGGRVRRRGPRRPRRHREHAAVPGRIGGHHRLPDTRRPPLSQGASAGHRGRPGGQAAQLPAHRAVARRATPRPPRPRRHRQGPEAGGGRVCSGRRRGTAHADPACIAACHLPGHVRSLPQPGQPAPGGRDSEPGRDRMNALWYARRLARMSPAEMATRATDQAAKRRWRSRRVADAALDPLTVPAGWAPLPVPLEAGVDVPEDANVRVKEAAEELLAGRWRVFACLRTDMAAAPDWFLDPSTGRRAPDRAYCFDIDHRDPAVVGDAKYVWELSRHQHLTVLAAAWYLGGDER